MQQTPESTDLELFINLGKSDSNCGFQLKQVYVSSIELMHSPAIPMFESATCSKYSNWPVHHNFHHLQ